MAVPLCCPYCHGSLVDDGEALRCKKCSRRFSITNGIPNFVGHDAVNEGKWTSTDPNRGSLLNLLVKKERFFLQWLHGQHGIVLDVGCGGGWAYFQRIGPVVGLDVSNSSLQNARTLYSQVVQASAISLPFFDETFDFVVSMDVYAHVPYSDKDFLITETFRVLKRGGLTLHYLETDGSDPLNNFAKQYPDLYAEHIHTREGHIGLESPIQTLARFRKAGFVPVKEVGAYKGLMYVDTFLRYFDSEYKDKSPWVRRSVFLLHYVARFRMLRNLFNLAVTGGLELLDPILPLSWSGGLLVCYRKL